jgi:hypothetical protein
MPLPAVGAPPPALDIDGVTKGALIVGGAPGP